MNFPVRILSIEDSPADFLQIRRHLDRGGVSAELERVGTRTELEAALNAARWDVVLSDFNVPGLDFNDGVALLRERAAEVPVIVVSGTIGDEKVVELMKGGITDFVLKDNLRRLPLAIKRAVIEARLRRDQITAHHALRSNEARLRQILRASRDGIWTIGIDERTTLINPAMAAMLGYAEEEMIGRPLTDFVDARGAAFVRATLGRLPHAVPSVMEGKMRKKNGDPLWVRVNTSALTDGQGAMVGALAIVSDITERHHAETEMRLQSAALNASADAVVIANLAGDILWVNHAFETLTGYEAAEAIGRNPRELVRSGVQDADFYGAMWNTLIAGGVWRGEIINRRKDGRLYSEDMTITPVVGAGGAIESYVAIKRDLTARKELEAQLLQAQKMESVGRLAGGIAHDFNNLLTVINGVSELALDAVPEGDPLRKDLRDIHDAGERAAALTRQLLAFSRKQVVKPEVLDLNTLVTGTQSMLRRMVGEDVTIVTATGPAPLLVKADIGQLEQLLLNLVVNARDAMPDGGTLTIAARGETLASARTVNGGTIGPGPYVVLSVTDTGIGVDEDTLSHVFDPFFTTKAVGKGTGLGLSTVYGIVQQCQGGLTVTSTVGEGSTFSIYLPAPGGGVLCTPDQQGAARGSETILIVEDEEMVRVASQRMIRAAGYDVMAVANAAEALLVLEHHDQVIDLLLTDVVMPGTAGPELAERATARHPDLCVLYMSGHTDNTALLRSVRESQQRLITKPFSAAALTQGIRDALDHRLPTREAIANLAAIDRVSP